MIFVECAQETLIALEQDLATLALEQELTLEREHKKVVENAPTITPAPLTQKNEIMPTYFKDTATLAGLEQELSLLSLTTELDAIPPYPEAEFSLFDAFNVRKETQVSSVMAYLFNLSNKLNFGDAFLKEFLRLLKTELEQKSEKTIGFEKFLELLDENLEQKSEKLWNVELEVNVPSEDKYKSRRPDIVLESERLVVFIENKILLSSIRHDQILETCKCIKSESRWQKKKLLYLLITPKKNHDRDIIQEIEEANKEYFPTGEIGWSEIRGCCERLIPNASSNSRLQQVLIDFVGFIDKMGGNKNGEG